MHTKHDNNNSPESHRNPIINADAQSFPKRVHTRNALAAVVIPSAARPGGKKKFMSNELEEAFAVHNWVGLTCHMHPVDTSGGGQKERKTQRGT